MKALTILIVLAGLALGLIALKTPAPDPIQAREVPRSLTHDVAEGHVVRAFQVEGMCCTGCPTKLREALMGVEGVEAIAADPTTGRVEVEALRNIDTGVLAAALTFDEYVARPIK